MMIQPRKLLYCFLSKGGRGLFPPYPSPGPPELKKGSTLFNDPTRDSIANNFVISFYCRCLQILYQITFFYKIYSN